MSARKYEETVTAAGKAFGVTPSSVSRHLVEATAKQLKQFQERSLEEFPLFAMYLDTVHRGGQAFVVALGVDREGKKLPLGFWEGATENHEICEELLEELERRGLKSKRILWVTDGGGGSSRRSKTDTARSSSTSGVLCTKTATSSATCPNATASAHHLFATALEQNSYKDAKKMLQEFETSTSRPVLQFFVDGLDVVVPLRIGQYAWFDPTRGRDQESLETDEHLPGSSKIRYIVRIEQR